MGTISQGEKGTCPFYEEIDAILGNRAASRPVILDSGQFSASDLPVTELEGIIIFI